ncbi:MAG: homogentisate 1,2-dioxygenase [Bdellovibrionales bacterium]|nr:homogentisate 1,2-dioxygenase [Bdellovibrionales bacterium]
MQYQSGFANHFESEAVAGSLPQGQNSPKKPLQGLYPEQLSGSAFTVDRSKNLRSWLYRIRPSVVHQPYESYEHQTWNSLVAHSEETNPQQLRWKPLPEPKKNLDFIDGVFTMAATQEKPGVAVHHYLCNQGMGKKFFYNADGELILIPSQGALQIQTEMGVLEIEPQEIAVIPRGIKFQINPKQAGWCRGYLGENTGAPLTLPSLGPLGANALANPRDFLYPVADYHEGQGDYQVVVKFSHSFWQMPLKHHPLDVVAWHGNYAPYKYDLRKFNTMGTVSYDHPDPSIYTVLTSPSFSPGVANLDFVIFPPRWLVGENTFRPPYYHRNIMSEYMGLIHGVYDAKQEGFVPGGASLHNCMSAHGPDAETFAKAIENSESPQKIEDTMAFMFETCHIYHPTHLALSSSALDRDYWGCWQNLKSYFNKG